MTDQTQFTINFDGEAVQNHEMDVADFARSLMGLSDLFEATNKKLNNNDAHTSLKIQATTEGSFEVVLVLIQQVASQMSSIPITIRDLVFGEYSLISVIKWLKGEKIQEVKEVSHDYYDVEIKKADGSEFKAKKEVITMLKDPDTRKAIQDFMSPAESQGIDSIKISDDKTIFTEITKSEVKYFAIPDKSSKDDEILKEKGKGWFTILSPDFEDGHKWKVSDGNSKFYVSFEDEKFIDDVQNKRISFGKDDMILCAYIKYQYHDSTAKLKTEYTVTKVLDRRSGAKQLDLM